MMRRGVIGGAIAFPIAVLLFGLLLPRAEARIDQYEVRVGFVVFVGDSVRFEFSWPQVVADASAGELPVTGYYTSLRSFALILVEGTVTTPAQTTDTLTTRSPAVGDTLTIVACVATRDEGGQLSDPPMCSRPYTVTNFAAPPRSPDSVVVDTIPLDTVVIAMVDSLTLSPDSAQLTFLASADMEWHLWSIDRVIACERHQLFADTTFGLLSTGDSACPDERRDIDFVVWSDGVQTPIDQVYERVSVLIVSPLDRQPATGTPDPIVDLTLEGVVGGIILRYTQVADVAYADCRYAQTPWPGWGGLNDSNALLWARDEGVLVQHFLPNLPTGVEYGVACITYFGTLNQDARFSPVSPVEFAITQ